VTTSSGLGVITRALRDGLHLIERAAWTLAAILAALCAQSIYHQPVGWAPTLVAAALALAAATRPHNALLVLAAIAPLSTVLFVLIRTRPVSLDYGEVVTLAYLAGWLARRAVRPGPLRVAPTVRWSAIALLLVAVASGVINVGIIVTERQASSAKELFLTLIARDYLVNSNPFSSTLLFLEGLVLVLVVADTCAADRSRRDAVLRMMLAGACAAAAINVLRIVTAAVQWEDWPAVLLRYFMTLRVNVHHGDLNAAGSYFVMMLFVGLGLSWRRPVPLVLYGVLMSATVWITGSRTALATAFLIPLIAGVAGLRASGRRGVVIAVAGFLVVSAVAFTLWRTYPRYRNDDPDRAVAIRLELARAALQMARAEPFFGVGLGRYYVLSNRYVGGVLAPFQKARENAHNNVLQILAELGIPGLLLFVSIVAIAMREAFRRAASVDAAWGLFWGLAAFLLTCLGGHPLLAPAAAYPFWMCLGLAAALSTDGEQSLGCRAQLALAGIVIIIAGTLPLRIAAGVREANVENTTVGLSAWQREPDGLRYRWSGGKSTFYVPSDARAVRIPLRHGTEGPPTVEVRVFLDGREADGVRLQAGDDWRVLRIVLSKRGSRAPFFRIDLRAEEPGTGAPLEAKPTDTAGIMRVGRSVIEP
jgi:O-antigen ligase